MKQLRHKEIREICEKLKELYGEKAPALAPDAAEDDDIIFSQKMPFYYRKNEHIIPTLHLLLKDNFIPTIAVDMGAVKFVVGGADIMRPGIVEIAEFNKETIVAVVDEKHHKPLCVGFALFSSSEIKLMKTGKVIKNIHYVGDEIWKRM